MSKIPPQFLAKLKSPLGMKKHPGKESMTEDMADMGPEGKETKGNSKKKGTFKPFKKG